MNLTRAINIAQTGFDVWAGKPHNKRWRKHIDGTPIPNDLVVCIAHEFALVLALSSEAPTIVPSNASAGKETRDDLSNLRDETARIVEKLRARAADENISTGEFNLLTEAADRIQALYVGLGRGLGADSTNIAAAGPAACAASETAGQSDLMDSAAELLVAIYQDDAGAWHIGGPDPEAVVCAFADAVAALNPDRAKP